MKSPDNLFDKHRLLRGRGFVDSEKLTYRRSSAKPVHLNDENVRFGASKPLKRGRMVGRYWPIAAVEYYMLKGKFVPLIGRWQLREKILDAHVTYQRARC